MILLDNTQIILASIFATFNSPDELNLPIVRHMVLNSYRFYRTKFKEKYGELVICHDSGNYWRKELFPYYKQNRKKEEGTKEAKDWATMFEMIRILRTEVAENFPYKNIFVPRCEADDVIAILSRRFHESEKILIVSSDKDFLQLQRYPNIDQYSPSHKTMLHTQNPQKFLFEHILRGDSGDGVPNVLSDDDTFITPGKRQRPLSAKKLNTIASSGTIPEELRRNFDRNQMLVDLSKIPDEFEEEILDTFAKAKHGDRSLLMDYFTTYKLDQLFDSIGEF